MHPIPRPLIVTLAVIAAASILFVFHGQQPVPTDNAPTTNTPQPTHPMTDRPPDVDALLPVSRTDLATVADLAARFATTYETYRYDEPTSTYLARLRPQTTPQLSAELARSATAPGLRSARTQAHEYATARATSHQFRAISPGSVIVVLDISQTTVSNAARRTHEDQLAITAITTTDGWRIDDVQPAAAGNAGDVPDAPDTAH